MGVRGIICVSLRVFDVKKFGNHFPDVLYILMIYFENINIHIHGWNLNLSHVQPWQRFSN